MLAHNQARYLLQEIGYLPKDLPLPEPAILKSKGGDGDAEDTN